MSNSKTTTVKQDDKGIFEEITMVSEDGSKHKESFFTPAMSENLELLNEMVPAGPPNAYSLLPLQEQEKYDIANYNRNSKKEEMEALGMTLSEMYPTTVNLTDNNLVPGFIAGQLDGTNNTDFVPYTDTRNENDAIEAYKAEKAYEAGQNWLDALKAGVIEDFGGDSSSKAIFDIATDDNGKIKFNLTDEKETLENFQSPEITIKKIEPAGFDENGNLIKFPEITTEDGNTTESSTLPNYSDPAKDPEAEAQIETIAADSTHNSAKALKALQEELNNHKFSPELMAQDYKQFLEEAGYIKDVDEQLYKSLIGVASALVMGYDVGEAITYGFGAQVEAQRLAKEEQDAKNDQMMDLLKEYGPNMTDDMWDAAIAELGANPNDSTLKFLTMGRDAARKSANAAAELSYIEKMVKLEKELYSLIDNEFNSLEETAEFTTMFNAVATQMRNSKKPGESLDEVAAKMALAKDRLIGAYGQWENYSKNVAGRPSSDRSLIKPWTWFKEKLPEITTPMVFFEGMHGLIDGSGANLIPLDPENKPEQYAKATLALHFLDGLEKDFQKNQIIQKDIFKKWSKEEKGQGGKFNNLDNYPDYFYAEVYKMFNARNQRLLAQ